MTWSELIENLTPERMPEVSFYGRKGIVTTIKDRQTTKGIAVRFYGKDYDDFFWAESGSDKRSKYMHELELIKSDTNE